MVPREAWGANGFRRPTRLRARVKTFACVDETKRGMLVRRLAGFHVVVDVRSIGDNGVRLWLDDGGTITLGSEGPLEVAR